MLNREMNLERLRRKSFLYSTLALSMIRALLLQEKLFLKNNISGGKIYS